jgi:hypothetical protein
VHPKKFQNERAFYHKIQLQNLENEKVVTKCKQKNFKVTKALCYITQCKNLDKMKELSQNINKFKSLKVKGPFVLL